MRILFSSNSPFCTTGYGIQCALATTRLKKMGHDVAIFAFFGLEGSRVDWGDIPIYPNDPRDFGIKNARMFYDDWNADILITLVDIWVLGALDPAMHWVPWFPVDHDPVPPMVVDVLKRHPGIVKPLVQSQFGYDQLKKVGVDSIYVPNDFDTKLFAPSEEFRKVSRERYGWVDKFVIGMVGTNHSERKNWTAALKAVTLFEKKHPDEIIFYMHTNPSDERGIDLNGLRVALGAEKFTFVPSHAHACIGITPDTMVRMYNGLDVFLQPSKGEGFCRPIIEAEACGVPVITTKCTSQAELVRGGWFIEKLDPEWTLQGSWQFQCEPEEIVERLEQAYQAKKDGSIIENQRLAREIALEYDSDVIFPKYWEPALKEIERLLKAPKNCEGVQDWRLVFIPKTCAPRKILDLGSGLTTPYKKHLQHLGEYVAADIRGGNDGIMKVDANKLPFKHHEFGFLWCSEMLEHCENPKKVLAEAKRVAKHGVILFSTPQNPFFKGDPDHKIITGIDYMPMGTGDGMVVF